MPRLVAIPFALMFGFVCWAIGRDSVQHRGVAWGVAFVMLVDLSTAVVWGT